MLPLCRISGSILALAGITQAALLVVPTEFATIQSALDAAVSGDIIEVGPGLYTENLDLHDIDVHLLGTSGAEATIVDGGGNGSVLDIHGTLVTNACIIEGFTFRNGTGDAHTVSGIPRGGVGGGILCRDGSDPLIRNNILLDNVALAPQGLGGGIFAWSCNPVIENNRIEGNSSHYGGGIFMLYSNGTVRNNLILDNTTQPNGKGGGIRVLYNDPLIEGNTLAGNYAHWIGSAIAVSEWGANPVIRRNLIVGNLHSNPLDYAYTSAVPTGCNLLWNNQTGNIWPSSQYMENLGGNLVADPLFCGDSWELNSSSPALPGNHPEGDDCGLIGAFGQGCGQTAGVVEQPLEFALGAPWPNPFNPTTRLDVTTENTGFFTLDVYNLSGQRVMRLHDGMLARGEHGFVLDAAGLGSGIYVAVLQGEGARIQRKLTLLK